MGNIIIRQLDPSTRMRLRLRAARHGRSMETEAREILKQALIMADSTPADLAESIRLRFAPLGGLELDLPSREALMGPPSFRK